MITAKSVSFHLIYLKFINLLKIKKKFNNNHIRHLATRMSYCICHFLGQINQIALKFLKQKNWKYNVTDRNVNTIFIVDFRNNEIFILKKFSYSLFQNGYKRNQCWNNFWLCLFVLFFLFSFVVPYTIFNMYLIYTFIYI